MNMERQNPSQFPTLTTDRLVLRKLEKNDVNEIFKLRSDDRVNQYLDRPKTLTINEAAKFINKIHHGVNNKECFYWAISLKTDNKLMGTICFWNIDIENSRAEIGYELHPDMQGRGFMQEALLTVIAYGFNTLGFRIIVAYLNAANEKSIRILEKNNFRRDEVLEEEYYKDDQSGKEVIYSLRAPGIS